MNDDETLDSLAEVLAAPDREPPADQVDEIVARADARRAAEASGPRRRSVLVGSAAAAVGALAGAAGTALVVGRSDPVDDAVGAPTEPVDFVEVAAGATASGRTIDHTWGLELLLDVSGLPVDGTYEVTYETDEGPVGAGGFTSVDGEMNCRFNAPPRRRQVTAVIVAEAGTGDVVLRGTV